VTAAMKNCNDFG